MQVRVALLLLIPAAMSLTACGRGERQNAERAASRFYAAVGEHDGKAACALLSPDTAKQVASQEQAPCAQGVLKLELQGGPVAKADVYSDSAIVTLRGGDTVFLDTSSGSWKIAAAGCKPSPHGGPYDCEAKA